MVSYLEGTVKEQYASSYLIIVGNVGYEVMICGVGIYVEQGNELSLYIKTFIKDDHMELYGFVERESLMMFEQLMGVSGIGSKMAAQIVSNLKPSEIGEIVQNGDVATFQKIPGIGKKVASRLVLELQSQFGEEQTLQKLLTDKDQKELVHALKTLGYGTKEIQHMVQDIPTDVDLEKQIQQALQRI